MTSFDLINSVHKQFFDKGLDVFDSAFDSWSKVTGFPFWNVVKYSKGKYGLELGLAGFKKENVLVEVNDGVLTIEGKVDDAAIDYVQKGLSTKSFYKQFSLPNEAVVDEATMEDGMLKIQFGIKEIEKKSKKVDIK
jgi:molecular chaperone IbpA|tara:strand:- start:1699 stop:2106 length:408 start_codon:yes stop_codon:yes gene_type:complete